MNSKMMNLMDWSPIYLEDGKRRITHQVSCSQDVKRVVETIDKVLRSKEILFKTCEQGGRTCVRVTKLGHAFFNCTKVDTAEIAKHYPSHRFNPLYTLFKRYCHGLRNDCPCISPSTVERLNLAVQRIREFGNGAALTKRVSNLQRCERANAKKARDLLASLRKAYSKLVVIRVDLEYFANYGPKNGAHAQAITVEQAKEHRDRFLAYLRKGPFTQHLAGYIWKMEYAFEKGCHFHFAIFLDGQRVRSDITIADLLGEKWKAITDRKGMYFSCNKKKEKYAECGIGMLNRGDEVMWGYLEKAIRYMTKIDHYIRFQAPERSRTFGVGGPYRLAP